MRGKAAKNALKILSQHGGILRMSEATRLGIHPAVIYQLRDEGIIDQLGRGLYALKDLPRHEYPDLVTVAKMVPSGVICLVSALFFHHLTTQIPHYVYVAIDQGATAPKVIYPPVQFFWFSSRSFKEGIEIHFLGGIKVKCYNKEKTLADCFKYRNKIGLDVALEALKNYLTSPDIKLDKLKEYAIICRVEKIMKPYIEAFLE